MFKFWGRRIKRIVPMALCVLILTSVVFKLFLYQPDQAIHSYQKLAAIFSVANIYFWSSLGNYWGRAAEQSPYLHYWSLSLEEQYYLIYPLILLCIYRYYPGKKIHAICILTAVSFLLFIYGLTQDLNTTFYMLHTRAWQLGLGCIIALLQPFTLRKSYLKYIGMVAMFIMFIKPMSNNSIGYSSLVVACSSALIIISAKNTASIFLFENRIIRYIGKISFSLYLWHWPIIVFFKALKEQHEISVPYVAFTAVSASFLLSILSYHFIENTFRSNKHTTIFMIPSMLLAGTYFYFTSESMMTKNYYKGIYTKPTSHLAYYDNFPGSDSSSFEFEVINNTTNTPEKDTPVNTYKNGGILKNCSEEKTPRIVVLGQSYAVMWCKLIDDICADQKIPVSFWAMNGAFPYFDAHPLASGSRHDYDMSRKKLIKKWKPDIAFVSCDNFFLDKQKPFFDFLTTYCKTVILIGPIPALRGIGNRNATNYIAYKKLQAEANGNIVYPVQSQPTIPDNITSLLSRYNNIRLLSVSDLYTTPNGILCGYKSRIYYYDDDHLNDAGILLAKERFTKIIKKYYKDRDLFPGKGR